jgi:cell division protein ZapA
LRRTLEAAQAGQCLAQVTISFNQRTYRFQCAEDEAERLEQLANYLKDKLDGLMREHGAIGDERLVLMAALTLADELFDARADIDDLLDDQTSKLKSVVEDAKGKAAVTAPALAEDVRKAGG